MKILAIETSCDETALALVEAKGSLKNPRFKILKSVISSQIEIHRPFGGVVPNLAKREHLRNLPILLNQLIEANSSKSKIKNQKSKLQLKIQNFLKTIDLIAVTVGPGLEPALWTGINFAEKLSREHKKKPLLGVNHLEGHLYSFLLKQKTVNSKSKPSTRAKLGAGLVPHRPAESGTGAGFLFPKLFPAVALIVSGGHTILLLMKSLTHYKKLGETLDDAAGEAFDKVARLLSLPYPGGPEIEKIAKKGNPQFIKFPRPMIYDKTFNFSFSGLKTSVLYYLRDHPTTRTNANKTRTNVDLTRTNASKTRTDTDKDIDSTLTDTEKNIDLHKKSPFESVLGQRESVSIADIAASFQQAVIDVLVFKTIKAAEKYQAKSVFLSGGVASNKALRESLKKNAKKLGVNFLAPDFQFNTDNAAMIGAAAYINFLKKKKHKIIAQGNLNL